MAQIEVTGSKNVLGQLLETLGEKPHSIISAVVSVTNGVINNTTISVEGASDENELVFKTFRHYGGIMDASKQMAKEGGFDPEVPFPVAPAPSPKK